MADKLCEKKWQLPGLPQYPHVRIISYTDIEVWTVFLREPSTS